MGFIAIKLADQSWSDGVLDLMNTSRRTRTTLHEGEDEISVRVHERRLAKKYGNPPAGLVDEREGGGK
jgi:hypothetical protein